MKLLAITSVLAALFLTACQSKTEPIIPIPKRPLDVMFLKTKLIENPDITYKYYKTHFNLKLTNPNDKPTWYVIVRKDSPRVKTDNAYMNKIGQSGKKQPFYSKKIAADDVGNDSKGVVYQVDYLGTDPFTAFYLPPLGSIELDRFVVQSQQLWFYFEVIEAQDIYVNSSKSINDWLPFNALCEKDSIIKGDYEEVTKDVGFVEAKNGLVSGYPGDKVNVVMVTPAKTRQGREYKWTVRSGIKFDQP